VLSIGNVGKSLCVVHPILVKGESNPAAAADETQSLQRASGLTI
jgi:hypothetical protein